MSGKWLWLGMSVPINVLFILLICRRLLFRLISIPLSTEAEFVNV
jgi:hypothetical protein